MEGFAELIEPSLLDAKDCLFIVISRDVLLDKISWRETGFGLNRACISLRATVCLLLADEIVLILDIPRATGFCVFWAGVTMERKGRFKFGLTRVSRVGSFVSVETLFLSFCELPVVLILGPAVFDQTLFFVKEVLWDGWRILFFETFNENSGTGLTSEGYKRKKINIYPILRILLSWRPNYLAFHITWSTFSRISKSFIPVIRNY